jgi:hypothetical protein
MGTLLFALYLLCSPAHWLSRYAADSPADMCLETLLLAAWELSDSGVRRLLDDI